MRSHFSLLTSHFSLLTSHFSLLTPCTLHAGPSCFKAWRRYEPTELRFDEFGECDWRTILQVGSNDLNTDRQTGFRTTHWNHRCRETWARRPSGPNRFLVVVDLLAVHVDCARSFGGRMVMRKGWSRHDRTQDHVVLTEK